MGENWVEDDQHRLVDRSSLELWTICPQQAAWLECGVILNETREMASGNAVHDALALVTAEYVANREGGTRTQELKDSLDSYFLTSRPDIQQDAIDGMRASA